MRKLILAAASTAALATFVVAPAHAVGVRYPFCLQGQEYPGLSNCTYSTYEQCLATASGRTLHCVANPYYAGDSSPRSYLNAPRRPPREPTFFDLFIHTE
jgi:hypothetical protein